MATLRVDMYGLPAAAIVGLFGACSGVGAVIGSLVGGFFARPSEAFYGPMMMMIAAWLRSGYGPAVKNDTRRNFSKVDNKSSNNL